MTMVATARSLVDPVALTALVSEAYGLPARRCVLLRSLVNDVYRVETDDRAYALKLYRAGHRTPAEVAWEVEASQELGGTVARGVPLADGAAAGTLTAAEGERPFSLWEWLPGAHPEPPYDDALFRRYGEATARLHRAADDAGLPPRRFQASEVLADPHDQVLESYAELIAATRAQLSTMDLDTGFCHGDVSLDNLHDVDGRLVFYDLDLAGTGPRAADLAGVASTGHFPAFLAGYRSVRALSDADVAAIPWLQAADLIGNLHFHLIDKPLLRGTESLTEGWYESTVDALRSLAGSLLKRP